MNLVRSHIINGKRRLEELCVGIPLPAAYYIPTPDDLAHARIYDRILERCAPILFDGKNFREENAGATRQTAKDLSLIHICYGRGMGSDVSGQAGDGEL